MAVWPATLPAPFKGTLQETPADNSIRSKFDMGPDGIRRRTTANVRPISFTMRVPAALVDVLLDFYDNDTMSGSLAFDYTHPRRGTPEKARFAALPSCSHLQGDVYAISVQLELLP